jgi:hypothetical protein
MAYRRHLRDAVKAQLQAQSWKLPDCATMTTQSLAYVYSKPGCSVADVFRTSYSTAIVSLLRGLGTAHAEIPAADSNISFAVTERDGVKPTSMLTTATLTDNGVTPACRITGTKTFLAEDTRDIIAIAKLTSSSTSGRTIKQLVTPRGSTVPLVVVRTALADGQHHFTPHDKPLPFLPELGEHGSVTLDGMGVVLTNGRGDFIDGTAALLGFRDVEDVHVAVGFAGHISRLLADLRPTGAELDPTQPHTQSIGDLHAASLAIASVVDDAAADGETEEPVLYSPMARIQLHASMRQLRFAVERALTRDGIPATLKRDAKILNIAQKVRDVRWTQAMRTLTK